MTESSHASGQSLQIPQRGSDARSTTARAHPGPSHGLIGSDECACVNVDLGRCLRVVFLLCVVFLLGLA
jgi:hypothetical protein